MDDTQVRVLQSGTSSIISSVDAWFEDQASASDPQIVNNPDAPNANRTALDIYRGLFNTAAALALPSAPASATVNATAGGSPSPAISAAKTGAKWILPVAAVALVYFLVHRSK